MLVTLLSTVVATVSAIYIAVKVFCPWLKDDFRILSLGVKCLKMIRKKIEDRTFPIDDFERQAKTRPNKPFVVFQDNIYTYEFVNQKANQIARMGLKLGLKAGDVTAIMMQNEPAFLWTYFGMLKIGVSVSMINYHLRLKSLAHSITSCNPQFLFVGQDEEIVAALKDVQRDIGDIRILAQDGCALLCPGFESLSKLTDSEPSTPVDTSHRANLTGQDIAAFIFTSGTTGLPKPAIVSHRRSIMAQVAFSVFDFNENDVLYETLPLYHSAGLNLGILSAVDVGATVILRRKFSASCFWDDCRKHNVTVIHYIGEMCRYLVNRPKSPDDGVNSIRVAIGNGLRMDIWEEFQNRFKLPNIIEFYAATESPVSFFNVFNKVGAVGRYSPVIGMLLPASFVEFDHSTQTAKRNSKGRCIKTGKNQTGLLIAPLKDMKLFEGYYKRPDANEKKMLRDVFKPGDVYFNTGDLFYLDDDYFVYFRDRTGDTFRWKGENVSTNEVANVLSAVDVIHDANVYGVDVPGCEGRAGMAAIHLKEGESLQSKDLDSIAERCSAELPSYARPKFLRVQRQMSLTSTFKQQKKDLVNEAFNPHRVGEPLYYFDSSSKHYQPISESVFEDIVAGKVSL